MLIRTFGVRVESPRVASDDADCTLNSQIVFNSDWKLYYWIRGQSFDNLNVISVSSDTTIKALGRLIVQQIAAESRLNDAPLIHSIYKVPNDRPIPLNESLAGVLRSLSISALGNSLLSVQELSDIFASPPSASRLHLIVDATPLSIRCWIRGADIGNFFEVKCSKLDGLGALKSAIKEKEFTSSDITESRLTLYKIPSTGGELARILHNNGEGQHLTEDQPLGRIFNDVPFSQTPFIVVDWVDEKVPKPPPQFVASLGVVGQLPTQGSSAFYLINVKGGTCLDISVDNVSVIGFGYHNGVNQAWSFESAGSDKTFLLQSVGTGKYLSVNGNPRKGAKTIVAVSPYAWRVEDEPGVDGGVRLFPASHPKLSLDLSNYGNSAPNTPVELWGRWDEGQNQVWKLQKAQ